MHNNPKLDMVMIINPIFGVFYATYYVYLIYQLIKGHQKRIPDHFSYVSSKITLNWVNIVLILFAINWLMTGFILTLNILLERQVINAGMVFFINIALFSFAISYFGFLQPTIFQSANDSSIKDSVDDEEKTKSASQKSKYKKSTLEKDTAYQYLEDVKNLLESEKLYLNPELTIQNISEKLEIPKHHLTESLNTYLGKSFYTLINEYRIEAFKSMAADEKNSYLTLLALAYDSGFNSKSAFNLVFKNYTGQTPSQYMKSISK